VSIASFMIQTREAVSVPELEGLPIAAGSAGNITTFGLKATRLSRFRPIHFGEARDRLLQYPVVKVRC
jgi:hypothetical protein